MADVTSQDAARVKAALRNLYPNGAPEFLDVTLENLRLHSDKNHDYAAGGSPLGNFDRVASILGLYSGLDLSDPEVVALVYMLKQVDQVLWAKAKKLTALVEGQDSRLADVSNYASLVRVMQRRKVEAAQRRRGAEL